MIDVMGQGGLDKYSVMDDTEVKQQLTSIAKATRHNNTTCYSSVYMNLYLWA